MGGNGCEKNERGVSGSDRFGESGCDDTVGGEGHII